MQAVILAGGLGTRLQSIVKDRPKPMAEIDGKPFLEYQVRFLKHYQVTELVFCVGHLHEQIQDYFHGGESWGVNIDYAVEKELLGTGGALSNAEAYLHETFFVLNGDSFFDLNLSEFMRFHQRKKSEHRGYLGSIALAEVDDARNYGTIMLSSDDRIVSFEEKSEKPKAAQINAGIYILERGILEFIPPGQKTSLERETMPLLLQNRSALCGYSANGFFVDIGTPSGFQKFEQHIQNR